MGRTTTVTLTLLFALFLGVSASAFDGQRKGKILAFGLGGIPAGPYQIKSGATTYESGVSVRLVAGFAPTNRTMFTFGIVRQQAFFKNDSGDASTIGTNWMLEISMTRYRVETHRSTFWRVGLGLMDWGTWGKFVPRSYPYDRSRQLNVALVGGVGWMFVKGLLAQLDIVGGPAPSGGDGSLKALIRLELVGIIY